MKRAKTKKMSESYYKVLLIILTLAILALLIKNRLLIQEIYEVKISKENTSTIIAETQIQEIKEKIKENFSELENYLNQSFKITILNQEELNDLSQKQPVIYGKIKAPIYKIEFINENKTTLLILYDPKSREILKKFEILEMTI